MKAQSFVYLYHNATSSIQIIRVDNTPHGCIERTVFPDQQVCFDATPDCFLEMQPAVFSTVMAPERIPCNQLEVAVYDEYFLAA